MRKWQPMLETAAGAALAATVLVLAPLAWLMRDGLGPDAVDSSGLAAVARWFRTFWTGPILIGLGVAVVLLNMIRRRGG